MQEYINEKLVSKAEAHPEDVREILEDLHGSTERARSEYIETAAAYLLSHQQEYQRTMQLVEAIRKEIAGYRPWLTRAEELIEAGQRNNWPKVIKEAKKKAKILRKGLRELEKRERTNLDYKIKGDQSLYLELLQREKALRAADKEERQTRLAIGDVLDRKIEELRVLFNQDPTEEAIEKIEELRELLKIADNGIPQDIVTPGELTFYRLEKRHKGLTVEEIKRGEKGLYRIVTEGDLKP